MQNHSFNLSPLRALALLLATLVAAFALITAGDALAGGGLSAGGDGSRTTEPKDGKGKKGKAKQSSASKARYDRIWDRTKNKHKRWAKRTAQCESGGDPKAIGGGGAYRGAFQFLKSTWKASPKSPGGDPIRFNYKTQAVVAVALKKRDGAGHWPVCG